MLLSFMKTLNKRLTKKFFNRSPDLVARELLGKVLCRKISRGRVLRARIVETEAYFDEKDPASRASKSKKKINKVHEMMLQEPGRVLLYNVHKYIMLNFVTQEKGNAGAVLIRALEPLNFSGHCLAHNSVREINKKQNFLPQSCSGPGRLTRCLNIDKNCNNEEIWVEDFNKKISKKKIGRSFRIGVSLDLKEKHRYFIKGNNFLSRKEK
jgi:DNA-3-methyladenine glycosylase